NVSISSGNAAAENDLNAYITNILTVEFNASGNSINNSSAVNGIGFCNWRRSKIRIGADNAFPAACPLTISGQQPSTYDYRWLMDLNGHIQTISNFNGFISGNNGDAVWFGNDSTNSDATLVFNSAITNTWFIWIVDNINTNLANAHKTGLSVIA